MNLIYVTKKWAESIGNAADLLLIQTDLPGDYAMVMASDKNLTVSGQFVEADVCRRPATMSDPKNLFLRARIPVQVIAAIFDFTEAESKKVGFTP
jgi:hypothetical protein